MGTPSDIGVKPFCGVGEQNMAFLRHLKAINSLSEHRIARDELGLESPIDQAKIKQF